MIEFISMFLELFLRLALPTTLKRFALFGRSLRFAHSLHRANLLTQVGASGSQAVKTSIYQCLHTILPVPASNLQPPWLDGGTLVGPNTI